MDWTKASSVAYFGLSLRYPNAAGALAILGPSP
jgi:hypothetical protein